MIHLIEAGHSYKIYGVKGELVIDIHPQFKKHILKTGVVFFKVEGNAVPFFIESVRGNEELMMKFNEVDTPEAARPLSNQILYIDDHSIKHDDTPVEEEVDEENFYIGFTLEDVTSGINGKIKSLEEFPSQLMALVEVNSKEFMIPIHEDWIVAIEEKNKLIRVELPVGLFDL